MSIIHPSKIRHVADLSYQARTPSATGTCRTLTASLKEASQRVEKFASCTTLGEPIRYRDAFVAPARQMVPEPLHVWRLNMSVGNFYLAIHLCQRREFTAILVYRYIFVSELTASFGRWLMKQKSAE
jgi:hypothetical protein